MTGTDSSGRAGCGQRVARWRHGPEVRPGTSRTMSPGQRPWSPSSSRLLPGESCSRRPAASRRRWRAGGVAGRRRQSAPGARVRAGQRHARQDWDRLDARVLARFDGVAACAARAAGCRGGRSPGAAGPPSAVAGDARGRTESTHPSPTGGEAEHRHHRGRAPDAGEGAGRRAAHAGGGGCPLAGRADAPADGPRSGARPLLHLTGRARLGLLTRQQVASLVGVAPWNRDSGRTQGRRQTWGGRGSVRTTLYMGTLVATRFNTVIRAFYHRLSPPGNRRKSQLACMRKLLTILNAMKRSGRSWGHRNPSPPRPPRRSAA